MTTETATSKTKKPAFIAYSVRDRGSEQKAATAPHKSSLLRTLGALVLLGSIGAALLDYVFKVQATETWGRGANLLRFFAFFHTGVAFLSLIIQSAAAKTALEKLGLGKTISTLPATLAGGSFLALIAPGLAMAALARAAEAAVRNSLFRAGYEICYTPVPAAQKSGRARDYRVGGDGQPLGGAQLINLCKQESAGIGCRVAAYKKRLIASRC